MDETPAFHTIRMNNRPDYADGYLAGLQEAQKLLKIAQDTEDSPKDVLDMFNQHLAVSIENPKELMSAELMSAELDE